ncbi:MAG: HNH endonuclease [Chloroflexi bacterium]|nr:HNH endonuclease [Chloroflexota bacterium]
MLTSLVLVLNQNYEPLNVCHAGRALILMLQGKAEMLENGSGEIHTSYTVFPLPSVIRLGYQVRRPRPQHKLTRLQVFLRDDFVCQYCGKESHNLTLDHVMPRFRGGPHTWQNVVSACIPCNHRKAGRTPLEAGMKLLHQPVPPRATLFTVSPYHLRTYPQWEKFLPQ